MSGEGFALGNTQARPLDALLSPLSPQAFVEQYWDKAPLHVVGQSQKFAQLFSRRELDRAIVDAGYRLTSSPASNFHLRATQRNAKGEQVHLLVEAYQVAELLALGTTLCVNNVDAGSDKLRDFAATFKRELGLVSNVQFACYLSTDGEGFDVHFDSRHAMTLQIEGEKRWSFSTERATTAPVANARWVNGHVLSEGSGVDVSGIHPPQGMREVLLRPGDILYLPPGTWHSAKASGYSLALNLGTPRFTFVDFLRLIARSHPGPQPFGQLDLPALLKAWRAGVAMPGTRAREVPAWPPSTETIQVVSSPLPAAPVSCESLVGARAHWGQAPAIVRCVETGLVFDKRAFDRAVIDGQVRHRQARNERTGFAIQAFLAAADGQQSELRLDATQVPDALSAGASVRIRHAGLAHVIAQQLAERVKDQLAFAGGAVCDCLLMSRAGAPLVRYNPHDTVLVQGEGASAVELLGGQVTLVTGDALYLPAGSTQKVSARPYSLLLEISLLPKIAAENPWQALVQQPPPSWLECIPPAWPDASSVTRFLAERLAELTARIASTRA